MLADLAAALIGRLEGMAVFGSVQGPSDEAVYPAAHLWLASDTFVQDKPAVTRQLLWNVQITSFDEDAPLTSMLALLDAVRSCFSGVKLSGHGHFPVEVPKIELAEYKAAGPMVYIVHLRITVYPQAFTLS